MAGPLLKRSGFAPILLMRVAYANSVCAAGTHFLLASPNHSYNRSDE
jgi:hypothetical protein